MSLILALSALGGLAAMGILYIGYYVLYAIGAWKINTKAGEAGWKAFIPFYNLYTIYKICWNTSIFWIYLACTFVTSLLQNRHAGLVPSILFSLCSLIALILEIIQDYKLALCFGKGVVFTLGLIFLQPVFVMILGLGSSRYLGNRYNSGRSL